jgi:preprotein translocase subunit SecF
LAGVSADDLAIIKAARVTAEAAETDAGGFNDAIDAAGGTSSAAGQPLQVGKIKNKVLKLQLEVLALQIDQAQSGKDNSAKIAAEQTKLNNNIKIDAAADGEPSQSVDFQGDDAA